MSVVALLVGVLALGPTELVREVGALVEQNFFDPQLRGVDWAAVTEAHAASAAGAVDARQRVELINRMLDTLDTSHTRYFSQETVEYYQLLDVFHWRFEDWLRERFPPDGVVAYPGIGLVTRERDGRHFVTGKIHGTPASRSTIAVGDEILAVDGAPFRPILSFEGKIGKSVNVTIQRGPSPSSGREVVVVPELLKPGEMYMNAVRTSARVIRHEDRSIGYVRMWSYAGEQYQHELEAQLHSDLSGADALILDIRDGWGGANPSYLNLFNPRVPVMSSRGRDDEGWRSFDSQWRKPVVLLVNEGTRSGKELLAYGFRKFGIGPVVGTTTAGSVTAGKLFRLSNDDLLYVAVSEILVDGERLEGRGVEPDVVVPFEVEYAAGRDPQLEKALDVAVERLGVTTED